MWTEEGLGGLYGCYGTLVLWRGALFIGPDRLDRARPSAGGKLGRSALDRRSVGLGAGSAHCSTASSLAWTTPQGHDL